MAKAICFLKWIPAILCGLLVMAWVVSLQCWMCLSGPSPRLALAIWRGTIEIRNHDTNPTWAISYERDPSFDYSSSPWGDAPHFTRKLIANSFGEWQSWSLKVPIPLMLTSIFPAALAPFIRFRFPLWSYFVWTALIAAELAYYLR